jgi:hypothetical protein
MPGQLVEADGSDQGEVAPGVGVEVVARIVGRADASTVGRVFEDAVEVEDGVGEVAAAQIGVDGSAAALARGVVADEAPLARGGGDDDSNPLSLVLSPWAIHPEP